MYVRTYGSTKKSFVRERYRIFLCDCIKTIMRGAKLFPFVFMASMSPTGETMAVNAAVKKAKPASRKPLDYLGISAHAAAAVGATVELTEDFEQLHRGHAMVLLVASKIVREVNLIRESVDEAVEEVDGVSVITRFAAAFWAIMTSHLFAMVLSSAALYAAATEVIEDMSPGGHHGAALLAINELTELLVHSGIVRGRLFLRILENRLFKAILLSAAAIAAFCEVFSSGQLHLRGHHGVAILACLKLVRCLGMSRDAWAKKKED